jgi:hypothetical protein
MDTTEAFSKSVHQLHNAAPVRSVVLKADRLMAECFPQEDKRAVAQ